MYSVTPRGGVVELSVSHREIVGRQKSNREVQKDRKDKKLFWTDRKKINRQTDSHTERKLTGRQADRQTERQTDRQTREFKIEDKNKCQTKMIKAVYERQKSYRGMKERQRGQRKMRVRQERQERQKETTDRQAEKTLDFANRYKANEIQKELIDRQTLNREMEYGQKRNRDKQIDSKTQRTNRHTDIEGDR